MAAVGGTAQQQTDARSLEIGVAALKAMAPAWLSAGRSLTELVSAALDIAWTLAPMRRGLMMSALTSALPPVSHQGT